jgi:hypothetical protein
MVSSSTYFSSLFSVSPSHVISFVQFDVAGYRSQCCSNHTLYTILSKYLSLFSYMYKDTPAKKASYQREA